MGWVARAFRLAQGPSAPSEGVGPDAYTTASANGETWQDPGKRHYLVHSEDDEDDPDIGWADQRHRVYEAFDVAQPVDREQDLFGRKHELDALIGAVLHRRNHAIVSGARGYGKTSLVRVFGLHADTLGMAVIYSTSATDTTFARLAQAWLLQVPDALLRVNEIATFRQRARNLDPDAGPDDVATLLSAIGYAQLIIVLDEFDTIANPALKNRLFGLLKSVSDGRLRVRFVLVGVDLAISEMTAMHPSMVRHVSLIEAAHIMPAAMNDLLGECARRGGMAFDDDARDEIAYVACGSPYHARLFGMHAALAAVDDKAERIAVQHVKAGLRSAVDEWATINPEHSSAIRERLRRDPDLEARSRLGRKRLNGSPTRKRNPATEHQGTQVDGDALANVHGEQLPLGAAPQFLLALHAAGAGERIS